MLKKSIAIALSGLLATSAHAALLTNIQGKVLVNQGDGFLTVTATTELKPGDRVLVRAKSSAKVSYGIDCVETLKSNRTFVVPAETTCHGGIIGSLKDAPGDMASVSAQTESGMGPLVIGGLFVTGISIAAMSGDDHPASP
jgi:hypothetical protein